MRVRCAMDPHSIRKFLIDLQLGHRHHSPTSSSRNSHLWPRSSSAPSKISIFAVKKRGRGGTSLSPPPCEHTRRLTASGSLSPPPTPHLKEKCLGSPAPRHCCQQKTVKSQPPRKEAKKLPSTPSTPGRAGCGSQAKRTTLKSALKNSSTERTEVGRTKVVRQEVRQTEAGGRPMSGRLEAGRSQVRPAEGGRSETKRPDDKNREDKQWGRAEVKRREAKRSESACPEVKRSEETRGRSRVRCSKTVGSEESAPQKGHAEEPSAAAAHHSSMRKNVHPANSIEGVFQRMQVLTSSEVSRKSRDYLVGHRTQLMELCYQLHELALTSIMGLNRVQQELRVVEQEMELINIVEKERSLKKQIANLKMERHAKSELRDDDDKMSRKLDVNCELISEFLKTNVRKHRSKY